LQARLPSVVVLGLSLYFAVAFGTSGAKTLLWMQLGLTDFATGAIAHSAGRVFQLSDQSLTFVTAALGAAKLAVAGYFMLAVSEHAATVFRGARSSEHGTLDLAVFAAAGLTILYAYPAWVIGEAAEQRTATAHILLLCVAAGAGLYQRARNRRADTGSEHRATAFPPGQPFQFGRRPQF
jgi:hypothetical protein